MNPTAATVVLEVNCLGTGKLTAERKGELAIFSKLGKAIEKSSDCVQA